MLLKFLHKFYKRLNLPWVQLIWEKLYPLGKPPRERKNVGSFRWRDIMSFCPSFFSMATCKANSGLSVAFWNDHSDLGIMKVKFPQLHSFARRKNCSLNQFLAWDESRSLFLPLSSTAYDQLLQLKVELLALHLQLDKSHEWSYV
jgi:hypothetical protein